MLHFSFSYKDDLETFQFIKEFTFKPYYYLANFIESKKITDFFIEDLKRFHNTAGHCLLTARMDNKIVGVCALLLSEWDSKLFGFNYGTIAYIIADGDYPDALDIKHKMIRYVIDWGKQEGVRFFHSRVDVSDISSIHSLERNGFTFITAVARCAVSSGQIKLLKRRSPFVRAYHNGDSKGIKEISGSIFTDNRFFLDYNFNNKTVQRLYAQWAKNLCTGGEREKVFVYEHNNRLTGFAACRTKKRDSSLLGKSLGSIELVGVDPLCHKTGIGVKVFHSAAEWIKNHTDLSEAVTALQNRTMIKILNRFGFSLRNVQLDFHWWNG